jgi:hypothetical protein
MPNREPLARKVLVALLAATVFGGSAMAWLPQLDPVEIDVFGAPEACAPYPGTFDEDAAERVLGSIAEFETLLTGGL